MKNLYLIFIILLAITVSSAGCDNKEEDNYAYSFKVISAGGNFTGYYFADIDTPTAFSGTLMTGSSDTYIFEAQMDPDNSITIAADGVDEYTTSITIYLFKDNEKIDTVTAIPLVTGGTVSALLGYPE